MSHCAMEQDMKMKNVEWNSDTMYALGPNKIIAKILGIWPLECEDVFSKIRFVTVAALQITMLFSLIGETFTECLTVNDVGALMTLVASSMLSFLKIVFLRLRFRSKIIEIVASAVNDWSKVKDPRAHRIMRKYAKICRFVFTYQMIFAYSSAVLLVVGALPMFMPQVNVTSTNESEISLNGTENLPLRGLPLATVCLYGKMSDLFYFIVFVLQAIQLLITVTGNVGNDVFFFVITMHLCAQFQLLGEDLEHFGFNVNEETGRADLIFLVKRHIKLTKLAENIEDSYNFIILMQLSANASQMCMMGIQMILSLQTGDVVMMINGIIILAVLTIQIYLYCYAGDRLSSQMEHLGVSVYFSPWYDLPPCLIKDVPFLIMRNHKGFNVTAGKIYRIDIDNFKNLLKALGSYFSVLRVMFDA